MKFAKCAGDDRTFLGVGKGSNKFIDVKTPL